MIHTSESTPKTTETGPKVNPSKYVNPPKPKTHRLPEAVSHGYWGTEVLCHNTSSPKFEGSPVDRLSEGRCLAQAHGAHDLGAD